MSVQDLMDEWVGIWNDNRDLTDYPEPAVPEPASEEQIEAYENEIGVTLPEELKDLYRYSNGLNAGWIFTGQMGHGYQISTNSLRPPRDNRDWVDFLEDLEPYNPHALSSLIKVFGDHNTIWMSLATGCEGKLFYVVAESTEGHGWAAESLPSSSKLRSTTTTTTGSTGPTDRQALSGRVPAPTSGTSYPSPTSTTSSTAIGVGRDL